MRFKIVHLIKTMEQELRELKKRVEAAELVNYVIFPRMVIHMTEQTRALEDKVRELMDFVDSNKVAMKDSLYVDLCEKILECWNICNSAS